MRIRSSRCTFNHTNHYWINTWIPSSHETPYSLRALKIVVIFGAVVIQAAAADVRLYIDTSEYEDPNKYRKIVVASCDVVVKEFS